MSDIRKALAQPMLKSRHGEFCLCVACLHLTIQRDERDQAADQLHAAIDAARTGDDK